MIIILSQMFINHAIIHPAHLAHGFLIHLEQRRFVFRLHLVFQCAQFLR